MHFSDYIKATLMAIIDEIAADPRKFVVNPGKDFTRNRKMGFRDTLLMLLTMEGDCIKEEIYRYFGRNKEAPSKSAFYRQRRKLNSQALANLLFMFNQKLPKELYNGKYQLIACDGSAADIFRNPDAPDTFFEPNGKSSRGFNQIHINAFFSILDRRFTNLVIQPGRKRNEYAAFCEMVDAAGTSGPPTIYFADMGYASYNNFAHVIENSQFFLIRCNDKRLAGILGRPVDGLREVDMHVDRILTRSQAKKKRLRPELSENYRYTCMAVPMDYLDEKHLEYDISSRSLRVPLRTSLQTFLILSLILMTSRSFIICAGTRKMASGISSIRSVSQPFILKNMSISCRRSGQEPFSITSAQPLLPT